MKRYLIFLIIFLPATVIAQKATIREETLAMKTYMFSDPNPVPNIGRIYPYFRFDGFTNQPVRKDWKMVILENPYIKVYVCPDIGGKVWGAIEKSTGKAFLYYNHVVKFRDVAMRGPWTSGGLEYNFGDIGHIPTCATPVDYYLKENPDGSVSCTVGALDLPSRTKWKVEIRLEKDKAFFETRTAWVNMTALPNTYYHWMNAAAKADGNLHFIYPGDHYIGHGGEVGTWPVENGRDLSWYENNNFGGPKSYHVLNAYANFFGGYWLRDHFGFGHMATYDDKPGKKLWIWGLSRQGMIWEDLLTDTDGQYIEFQAGKLFNQAAYSSTFTPFKHKEFPPYDTDVMTERWFPLVGTGGMAAASEYAVLNIEDSGDKQVMKISALQQLDDTLTVISGGKVVVKKRLSLTPLQLDSLLADIPRGDSFSVLLGKSKLKYSSGPAGRIVDRPLYPNPAFDWSTAYGLYVKGFEAEKQRRYEEALKDYDLSLQKEKAFAPALNRKALLLYKKMDYGAAKSLARKSLAVNAYDPLANYVFGLSCNKLGETANARSGFSIAAASVAYRNAAYTQLAKSFFVEKDYAKALHYARKALDYNTFNATALELEALIYRKTKRKKEAEKVLRKLTGLDPTLHFTGFEKYLWNDIPKEEFLTSFYNELPVQSFLELSLFYYNTGCLEEAGKVLELAPEGPLVWLWRSRTDRDHTEAWLQKVMEAPVSMVYPYRTETAEILEKVLEDHDNWKLKYYLGLIYWNKGRKEKAKKLFIRCGNEPAEGSFWLAKARLFVGDDPVVLESVSRAHTLAPDDWRTALAYIKYMTDHNRAKEIVKLAKTVTDKNPERPALGLNYAKALIQAGEYSRSIHFLEHYNVLPFEGAVGGRVLFHEACLREALAQMKKKKYSGAVALLKKAKEWPENLGAGKPYEVDERTENYLIALVLEKAGKKKESKKWYEKTAGYRKPQRAHEGSGLIFQLLALQKLGREQEAKTLLDERINDAPGNPYLKWVAAVFRKDTATAREIERKLLGGQAEENPYDITYRDKDFEMTSFVLSAENK